MIGSTVGSYRILQQLGEGGMGAVYLAEHALLGRRAAIKVLLPALSRREEIVTRFFNEARAATAIPDPGIVQIFDFGFHEGVAFIVMELLVGEALDKRLETQGRLAAAAALRIARQIAGTLGAAHERGIIHRDLKPENIFLVRDPEVAGGERVKILDFGIAKLAGVDPGTVKTQVGTVMGTPLYMSPEQCRGAGEVDHRSDVYALGCVLYHMICGRPPFVAQGMGEVLAMQMYEEAVAPGVGVEVDAMVLRCLAKNPGGRFANMAEVAAEAERLLTSIGGTGGGWAAGGGERVSGDWRAPSLVRTPTTLGGAAGARETAAATTTGGRRGRWWVVAAAVGVVAVAAAAVLAVGAGEGGSGGAAGRGGQDLGTTPATAVDAGVAVEAAAPVDAAAAPPPPIDAAAAPVDAAPPVDAPSRSRRSHRERSRDRDRPPPPEAAREVLPPPCPLDDNGLPTTRC